MLFPRQPDFSLGRPRDRVCEADRSPINTYRLIPIDLDGYLFDGYLFDGWDGPKAELVRSRLAADFTGWKTDNDKFEAAFERVIEALKTGRELDL